LEIIEAITCGPQKFRPSPQGQAGNVS
jgi:hypothetical protein